MIFNPSNNTQLLAAFSKVETDFSGFYAVQGGDTWNSVAQTYGLTGSQLADLNNTFASGSAMIGTSVIVVPSSASTYSPGTNFSVPVSTGNDYAYDISTGTYRVVGTAFQDTSQGEFSVLNGSGQVTDIASGLTLNVTAVSNGAVANLTNSGSAYTVNFATNGTYSVQTSNAGLSVFIPGLDAITATEGVLSLGASSGNVSSMSENSSGSSAVVSGSGISFSLGQNENLTLAAGKRGRRLVRCAD